MRGYSYSYPKNLISRAFLAKRHAFVRSILDNSINLDVGCGLYKITSDSVGLDIKDWKEPDVVGSALEIPYPEKHFDSLTLLHVIEHFHPTEQRLILGEAKRVLKDGGQLVVSTPNMSPFFGPLFRLVWWLWERAVNREYLHEHIGMVPKAELLRAIEGSGFRVVGERRNMVFDYTIEATTD